MNNELRELLEEAAEWLEHLSREGSAERTVAEGLRAILAKPSETDGVNWKAVANEQMEIIQKIKATQPQGEPVAWYKPHWNGKSAEWRLGAELTDAVFPEMWEPLYTRPAEQAAPEGWKLVPTVPTDDMIVAFAETWYSKRQAYDDPDMLDAYRDMLAVAPNPPQQ